MTYDSGTANIGHLEQSVECPLNHNAQILVQTAQCRILFHFPAP